MKLLVHPLARDERDRLSKKQRETLYELIEKIQNNPYCGVRLDSVYQGLRPDLYYLESEYDVLKIGYRYFDGDIEILILSISVEPSANLIRFISERITEPLIRDILK